MTELVVKVIRAINQAKTRKQLGESLSNFVDTVLGEPRQSWEKTIRDFCSILKIRAFEPVAEDPYCLLLGVDAELMYLYNDIFCFRDHPRLVLSKMHLLAADLERDDTCSSCDGAVNDVMRYCFQHFDLADVIHKKLILAFTEHPALFCDTISDSDTITLIANSAGTDNPRDFAAGMAYSIVATAIAEQGTPVDALDLMERTLKPDIRDTVALATEDCEVDSTYAECLEYGLMYQGPYYDGIISAPSPFEKAWHEHVHDRVDQLK